MKRLYIMSLLSVLILMACEDLIQGPEDEKKIEGSSNMAAVFSEIQSELLTPSCALSGCHGGSQNPNLSAGQAYNNLVNKASLQTPTMMRVKPGDSNNSYLMKKITGDGTSIMPPAGQISQAQIDSISLWINKGALNN